VPRPSAEAGGLLLPGGDRHLRPERERSACGIGFVADVQGRSSRAIVQAAIGALARLRHRGAIAADARTGDGAGMLLPLPRRFLAAEGERAGVPAADPERLGLASVFVPRGTGVDLVRGIVEAACLEEGIVVLGWRNVPVRPDALGDEARASMPSILHAFLTSSNDADGSRPQQHAHRARRRAERELRERGEAAYFPSFGFRTVTYKALAAADQLAEFYPDLQDAAVEAPFAVFHQRYSTNTGPTWERAQPFRSVCHNGEINTIWGNVARMRAREGYLGLSAPEEEDLFRPVVDESGSDSAILDEVVELLTSEGGSEGAGRDIRRAVAMLVPAAWRSDPRLEDEVRDFYAWHTSLMEPWDGPAALVFSDGLCVGAALDRNGLRPLRYAACEDGLVICASEAGVVDLRDRGSVRRGKVGPGEMMVVDPRTGGLQLDPVRWAARQQPYGEWLHAHRVSGSIGEPAVEVPSDLVRRQVAHGFTREEITLVIGPSAATGKEPTFSMGDDTPLAVLSRHERPLYGFFKQRFAQVTNPPIDHLRERSVMSLRMLLGRRAPLLRDDPKAARLLELESFLLYRPPDGVRLDATWPADEGPPGLRPALELLAHAAIRETKWGARVLLVSDEAIGPDRAPVPSLLAVGAVNTALVRRGLRDLVSIAACSDDARESHHVACLLGAGAEAVHPRLALATVASLAQQGRIRGLDPTEALLHYRKAVEEGVLKVLSKMGISCLDSYRGGELLDAIGIGAEVIDLCFRGASSSLRGIGFDQIAAGVLARHERAFGQARPEPANPGLIKYHRGGEYHATNPAAVRALHLTVDPGLARLRSTAAAEEEVGEEEDGHTLDERAVKALHEAVEEEADFGRYERFASIVNGRPPSTPRDLLELVPAGPAVPLDDVEPAERIVQRFSAGGISHGAVSREAHETIAVAFNRLGIKANSGEGGESPARFGTERNCRIKQVASGRFGVTPEYCSFADELQIKIAQGSKPGEGGQLPGHKVTEEIARLRHTQPGVALISPPPHHDIYSIEDLAELIYDLKQVNPLADVSVKLVAEAGVGTIAAGVVKALAEVVHIAGADGGTGASPLSSIKNVGLPWELGLAETQRALAASRLRDRVRVRVDGGIKTGRDVVVAALLGADEMSFGTALLVAEGCIMVRTCHLDTCPTGIATQNPELRARFAATPEMVMRYILYVAEEVRRILASLGLRGLEEAIGRVDLLRKREVDGWAGAVDVSTFLTPYVGERHFQRHLRLQRPASALGDRLFADAWAAVQKGGTAELAYTIRNEDRAVGARLGGAIGRRFRSGEPPGRAVARFDGEAGQSFGAFLSNGVELRLVGEANDYVGKSMSGGVIVVAPPPHDAGEPCLVGNTALYGATGGEVFVAGSVGERFAVRNSGATAVIEGSGDHLCEYMTGGTVVVLGPVGANVGAGMTGGQLFVHDAASRLRALVNPELVDAHRPTAEALQLVRRLVERHLEVTGSARARALLAEWDRAAPAFWRVAPRGDIVEVTRKDEGTLRSART
jgi:glutamate synthase domain-containing protein 2/glutamate synthase domain-containing protein 1/glutamate synthase domain-containing protein 3